MKRFKLLILLFTSMSIIFSSCDKISKGNTLSTEEANMAAASYLVLNGAEYSLNLTHEEAAKLGIAHNDYEQMLRDIELVNAKIKEMEASNVPVKLFNPQNVQINLTPKLLKTRSEYPISGGMGTLPDQNPHTFDMTVPQGASEVNFSVWSNSLIGVGTVIITKHGQYTGSDCVMTLPIKGGTVSFPVQSGYTYTVTIYVTSSGGGQYGYNFR